MQGVKGLGMQHGLRGFWGTDSASRAIVSARRSLFVRSHIQAGVGFCKVLAEERDHALFLDEMLARYEEAAGAHGGIVKAALRAGAWASSCSVVHRASAGTRMTFFVR